MKITGIIAEYNPFHKGHEYHIQRARSLSGCDAVAVVMSGNYVQRGEPAIIDKYRRAEAAVDAGANLVVELPLPFACQNAELFARCAIRELAKLNIDSLSFGCEKGDVSLLMEAANIVAHSYRYTIDLKSGLSRGLSYPAAAAEAMKSSGNEDLSSILKTPNNMLALEYIKSAAHLGCKLKYHPVRRVGSNHLDTEISGIFDSATAIRNALHSGSGSGQLTLTGLSKDAIDSYINKVGPLNSLDRYWEIISYRILSMGAEKLNSIYGVSEGLNNKLFESVKGQKAIDEIIMSVKSKRYTYSRIRRILLNILLDITSETIELSQVSGRSYVKVLSLDETGARVLKHASSTGTAVIGNYSDYHKNGIDTSTDIRFILTSKATDIYYLPYTQVPTGMEHRQSPVFVRKK